MKKTSITFSVLLVLAVVCSGQNQYNIWYFGKDGAGLDFNGCEPVVLTDGWPGGPSDFLFEGSSTICDAEGDLLFYTNGRYIFNSEHQIMAGAGYAGSSNSICQNVIIPKPGSESIYYMFTTEPQSGGEDELGMLYYTVVDMSLEDDLGAMTETMNVLIDDSFYAVSEKLIAAYHQNGVDIWLVGHMHGNNRFFAYLITEEGINPEPVYSDTGPPVDTPLDQMQGDNLGEMRISPDGTKIGFTVWKSSYASVGSFDNATGEVSDCFMLSLSPLDQNTRSYGYTFSPDNSKLYVNKFEPDTPLNDVFVYQFDVSILDSTAVNNSRLVVHNEIESQSSFFSMKIGPDRRVYIGRSSNQDYIGYIEFPDLVGTACNVVPDGIYLEGLMAQWGLNNAIELNMYCTETSIDESESQPHEFFLSPNPATHYLTINTSQTISEIEIVDVLGRRNHLQSNERVDISAYPNGIYLVNVKFSDGLSSQVKLVVE